MNDLKKISSLEELRKCLDLFNETFNLDNSLDVFEFKHFSNPNSLNDSFFWGLFDGDKVIGITALIPIMAKIKNEKKLIGQGVDSAVSNQHRRKGVFSRLVTHTIENCDNLNETSLLYSTTTPSASKSAREKLGFQVWENIERGWFFLEINEGTFFKRFIKFCFSKYSLVKLFIFRSEKELIFKEENVFHDYEDASWEIFTNQFDFCVLKTHDYLNWRIKVTKENLKVIKAFKDEQPLGYIIYNIKNNRFDIVDFTFVNNMVFKEMLSFLVKLGRKQNLNAITIRLNASHRYKSLFQQLGFLRFIKTQSYKIYPSTYKDFRSWNTHLTPLDRNE